MAAFGAITYIIRQFLIVVWTITEDITHRQSTATVVKISENAVLWPKKGITCPLCSLSSRNVWGTWRLQKYSKREVWCTHYMWRTRFEWRTRRVDRTSLHYQPTPLVPRPRFGLRANPSSGYLEGGTLVWTLPKRTSPQPTRGDVQFKI